MQMDMNSRLSFAKHRSFLALELHRFLRVVTLAVTLPTEAASLQLGKNKTEAIVTLKTVSINKANPLYNLLRAFLPPNPPYLISGEF